MDIGESNSFFNLDRFEIVESLYASRCKWTLRRGANIIRKKVFSDFNGSLFEVFDGTFFEVYSKDIGFESIECATWSDLGCSAAVRSWSCGIGFLKASSSGMPNFAAWITSFDEYKNGQVLDIAPRFRWMESQPNPFAVHDELRKQVGFWINKRKRCIKEIITPSKQMAEVDSGY